MAENVIDTLQLDIIVNTKQNGQSITTLRNSLEKLYKFLNGVKDQDFSKISNDIAKIGGRLTPLINAINSLDGQGLKNLTSLGTRLQTLNKRMGEIDAKAMAHKFDQMTQAITPFIDKVMSAQDALVALNNVMGGAKVITKATTPKATTTTTPKATTSTNILGGNLGKSLNLGSMVAKLYFVRNITKQLGQNLAKVVQYGIDYEETLNLWQVAMKGNTAEARKFITEMNRAYGISEATLMNYQAIFKNMLSALGGVSHDIAYDLSELMTQMALDYASLYNVGIEESMTKFQAVLAGQVRPIRNESGYDITQATLFEVYKDIGGTKTVRQLSETEKRLLRILAVYRQMRDTAVGDLEKTITSSANQLRLMGDTIKDIATWIGVGANQWLQQSKILIRINAYLLALRELAKSFAVSMGYIEPTGEDNKSAEQKQTDNLLEGAEGTADAYKEANKQVDELQGKLLGFDKFQVLSSAGVGETNTDIDKILEELQKAKEEYQGILDQSQNIALFGDAEKNIKGAYDILKDWGYEYDEQSKQWLKDGKTVKENIEDIAKSLGGVVFTLGLVANPWIAIASAIEYCYWTNEDFKKSVNESFERIKSNSAGIAPLLASVFEKVLPLVEDIAIFVLDILNMVSPLINNLMPVVVSLIEPIGDIISSITVYIGNILKLLSPILLIAAEFLKILKPILQIVNVIFNITQVLPTSLSMAITTPLQLVLVTCEAVLKVIQTIVETVRTLFAWDWASLGNNLSGIWKNWNFAGKKVWNESDFAKPLIFKAEGGLANKGSLFYAGEAGPELVTRTSGGNSTIMNMAQLENAVAKGMFRALAGTQANESEQVVNVGIDGQNLFTIFRGVAKRNGYDLVKVN
jgi:hypothetical protein